MASFRESLSKGLTTINVKTNNFMEESKCKTYISTLEKEIRDLKLNLGDIMYESWLFLNSRFWEQGLIHRLAA